MLVLGHLLALGLVVAPGRALSIPSPPTTNEARIATEVISSPADSSAIHDRLLNAQRFFASPDSQTSSFQPQTTRPRPQSASAIAADDPAAYTAWCVEVSLSYPRWDVWDPMYFVHNYSTGTRIGDFRFAASNIATDLQADCLVRNISLVPTNGESGEDASTEWHDCSLPGTQFQFNLETWVLRIRGNWTCGESPLKFVGEGDIEIPLMLGCLDEPADDSRLCLMSNTNVWPTLSSPVAIHPVLPQPPYVPWERSPLCGERSIDPSWQIDGLVLQHFSSSSPSVSSSLDAVGDEEFKRQRQSRYELVFDITNQSNEEKVHCVVRVDEMATPESDHSARWVECGGLGTPTGQEGNEVLFTEVMFDGEYSLLGVRQTWRCKDVPDARERFNGVGYLVASGLKCSEPVVVGGEGEELRYNCTLPSTTIDGYNSPPPAMPHTAYERSCTLNSLNATSLVLRGYEVRAESESGTAATTATTTASFTLYNPGSGDAYELWRVPVLDDGAWHDCVPGPGPLPWQLMGCRYSLDRATGLVGFQVQWYCDDRDPSNPILFSATASGKMPAEECDAAASGRGRLCHLPTTTKGVELPMSALTWKTTAEPMQRGPLLPWI